ncbi:conjugal transfer protein TraC, partial [Xanthomonas citri pv. citri]|nr:conjugal transfer protein TraC [Xanthomonas citri pv. citri]
MFLFDAKPDQATRTLLKRYGFKWSPSRDGQPWVRQLNNAGIYNGRQVFDALNSSN